ncbi:MAG: helix-turn-helix domain-containing protein [bacterium]|nr:helix-turn-helix domain-containing protein [bacterium]
MTATESLWTVDDVAAYLRVAVQSVYRWASQNKIPCRKVGGSLRFEPEEVKDWTAAKPKRRGRPPKGLEN